MGKKGKVQQKRLRVQYRAKKKKEAKKEKRLQWKLRRPLSHELATVQEGVADAIREQGGEPCPVTYFACLLSLLQARPDPKKIPYFLALLDMQVPHLNEQLLRRHFHPLVDALGAIFKQHAADPMVSRKGMGLVRSLFIHVEPSASALQRLGMFEPNKVHTELMTMYMKTLQQVFLHIFRRAPTLVYDAIVPLVRGAVANFFETAEVVAQASANCLKAVLERATTRALVTLHRPALDGAVAELHRALCEPQYRQNWDLICDCLAAVAGRLGRLRGALTADAAAAGDSPFVALRDVAVTADRLRSLDDFHFNSSAEGCVGAIARCVPAAALLKLLPLDVEDSDPIRGRHYLLNVLRKNVAHDSLGFYLKHFAPLTAKCSKRADDALIQGQHVEAKTMRLLHQQIWELLPGFATFPNDLAEGAVFRTIAKELTKHLNSPELCKVACRTLVLLVEKNKALAEAKTKEEMLREAAQNCQVEVESDSGEEEDEEQEESEGGATATLSESGKMDEDGDDDDDDDEDEGGEDAESLDPVEELEAALPSMMDADFHEAPREDDDPHGFHGIPRHVAQKNVEVMSTFARNVLPLLCNASEREEDADRRSLLLATLRSYSAIAPAEQVSAIFHQVHKVFGESDKPPPDEEAREARRQKHLVMMDIGCVLTEYLDPEALGLLLGIIAPLLVDPAKEFLLQKKSYKALARMCKTRKDTLEQRGILPQITAMLAKAGEKCGTGSRRERLQCITYVTIAHAQSAPQLRKYVGTVLPEVLLGLKEPNVRARDMAYFGLEVIAGLLSPERGGGAVDGTPLCKMVIAGLGGTTPALVSCTLLGLARIVRDYGERLERGLLDNVVRSSVLLIQHRANEIKSAAMAFAQTALRLAARRPALKALMEQHFDSLVKGCLAWTTQTRVPGSTRRTVRLIVERAIKRFGLDWVRPRFPEEHRRFVDYVYKEWQKGVRQRQREREERRADAQRLRAMKKAGMGMDKLALHGGAADESQFDLLDAGVVKSFAAQGGRTLLDGATKGGRADGFNVAVGDEGDLVVESEADHRRRVRQQLLEQKLKDMKNSRGGLEELGGLLTKRKRRRDEDEDDEGDAAIMEEQQQVQGELKALAAALKKTKAGRQGKRLSDLKKAKRPRSDNSDVRTGRQFRGGGATGGDVKKVGGVDPFAYVPLNAKFLNKRHRKKQTTRVDSVGGAVLRGGKAKRRSGISGVQQAAQNVARREAKKAGKIGKAARRHRS